MIGRRQALFGLGLGVSGLGCQSGATSPTEIMVAAAMSLRNVMIDIVRHHESVAPNVKVSVTYGASGDLRQQIEGGAPVDLAVFASRKPIESLVEKHLAEPASVERIATNHLVLIGPKGGPKLTFATLGDLPKGEKLAIGDPGPVPAGQYAKEALIERGLWDALESRLVLGGDVGAVLKYARQGEVVAAIVYETEARGVTDIEVLDRAERPLAEIVGAIVAGSRHRDLAVAFFDTLKSAEGQRILGAAGFGPP